MTTDATILLQELHDEYAASLWGLCLHLTGVRTRAEDVVRETLLRACSDPRCWTGPARLRAVLLECYCRGRSVAEAATQLGIPEGTVKSRTHDAPRALRLTLQEMGVTR